MSTAATTASCRSSSICRRRPGRGGRRSRPSRASSSSRRSRRAAVGTTSPPPIARHETGEPALALEQYDDALEALLPPGGRVDATSRARALEALRGIESLLTAAGDWRSSERTYRLLIDRLPPGSPARWRCGTASARSTSRASSDTIAPSRRSRASRALDPAKPPHRVEILARLYAVAGQGSAEPMADHAEVLLAADPSSPGPYRLLAKAYFDAGHLDEAWCACRALVFLKQATPAEEALYRSHVVHERRKAKGVIDDEA